MLVLGILIVSFEGNAIILFYYVVGGSQLISFFIRAFLPEKKSVLYIIYGVLILPVWVSLMITFGLKVHSGFSELMLFILIGALIYSPVMAVLYIYDNYSVYKSYK